MATRNARDVTMTLAIETLGEDNVDRLKQSILQLAKEGGNAAPEFQALADEIDRIGKQGQAVQAFAELARETDALREQQTAASASARKLADDTEVLWASVQKTRTEQREATKALTEGRTANVEAGNAIRLLKTEYDAAGKGTAEYRDRLRELTVAQGEAKAALVELGAANAEANKNAREAETAFAKTQKEFTATSTAADKLTTALREQEAALEQSVANARELGVSTENVAAAEAGLLQALNATGRAAQERAVHTREMAEADRLAAVEAAGMLDLYKRGEAALQAEVLAQRDAEDAIKRYTQAKAQAVADQQAWQAEADAIVSAAEATRRMEEQTRKLVEERRALAAQELADKLQEEAAATAELTARMHVWEAAFDGIIQKETEAAEGAKKLDAAFDKIGISQAQELTAEIQRIRDAMATVADKGQLTGQQLKVAFAAGEAQVAKLERELRELNGTLTLGDKLAGAFKNSMGQIAVGNLVADGIASIVERVKDMGRQFIEVTVTTERLRKSLDAIYKDSGLAAQQFEVLRTVAREAGVSVNQIRDSFVRFSASAHSAGIEVGVANDLFRNLTIAGASLGLTSDQVSGALDALGQMASKGVVSMEELRQQLGDRLPGALGLAARGLGLTEQQLIKLVETGQLTTDVFFPAFSKALVQMHGDTNTVIGGWARMTNMLTELAQVTAESETAINGMALATKGIGVAVGGTALVLSAFVEGLTTAGKAAILLYEAITGNGAQAWEWFNAELEKTRDNLDKQEKVLMDYIKGVNTASDGVNKNTVSLGTNTSSLLANAAAHEKASNSVGATGSVYAQTLAKMSEQTAATEANTVAAERLAKAKKLEGDAFLESIRLSGDAAKASIAQTAAAEANVVAAEKVVAAKKAEVDLTQQAIDVIQAEGTRRGGLTSAMTLQIGKLTETITKQKAALEESVQATAQLQSQAAAVGILSKAYGDNATNVDAFRKTMLSLQDTAVALKKTLDLETKAVAELKVSVDAGKASNEEYQWRLTGLEAVKKAYIQTTKDASAAEAMYRDAVKDATEALARKAEAEAATLSTAKAALTVSEAKYKALAEEARLYNNTALAIHYEREARAEAIKIKEIELKIDQLKIAAKEKELAIQLLAIKGTDDESRTKRERLLIEQEMLKAQKELLGLQEVAIQTDKERLRLGLDLNETHQKGNEVTRKTIDLTNEQTASEERLAEAKRKRLNIDKEGYSLNSAGQRINAAVPNEKYVYDTARSQGLSEQDAAMLADSIWRRTQGQGTFDSSTNTFTDWFSRVNQEISRQVLSNSQRTQTPTPTPTTTPVTQNPGSAMSPGTVVDIRINGKSTPVSVSSQQDANVLIGALRVLENQANTAARP